MIDLSKYIILNQFKISFFVNQILEIELLEYGEQILDLNMSNIITAQSTEIQNETHSYILPCISSTQEITSWSISTNMQEIINQFEDTILHKFPCILCSICSKLMYLEKTKWISQNPNFQYPLITIYPTKQLITNPNPPLNQIAICSS
ncbi:555_t:CDS:1, partial [Racocetra persica]